MSNVQLWIVGSIGIDAIETPAEKRTDVLGGSVTYACAAASFFTQVGAVGVVGSDFPGAFLERYRRFGIDLAGLLGNIGPALQLHVLDQTRGRPFVVADTMDLWIRIARPELEQVIRRANLLTVNDAEARLLTGRHNLLDCARAILEMGPQYVVIKKGEHGAMLCSAQGVALIPAFPVEQVVDPTGAGDCFAGAFMGFLAAAAARLAARKRRGLVWRGGVQHGTAGTLATDRD